jgi:hypothetical protein
MAWTSELASDRIARCLEVDAMSSLASLRRFSDRDVLIDF